MAAAEATAAAANHGSPTTVANCRNTEEATRSLSHHNQLFCPRLLQQKQQQQLLAPPLLLRLVVNTSCFPSMRKTTATCEQQWHGLHATSKARKEQERVKDNKGIDELTIEDGVGHERESALAWGSDLGLHQNG